jgi:uncharacterized membrane protein YhfC
MPGIYGMAAVTISLTAILCFTTLNHLTRSDRRYYGLILAGLPLSFIVNRFVKTPAIASLATWTGTPLKLSLDAPWWFITVIWLNAPIFEEAIKVLPVALPASRRVLKDASHALWAGLALGMGFGLGEAAYLAYGIAQSPAYNQLPWHMFTGFATERLIVTFAHGMMTAIAVLGLFYGKKNVFLGYLAAAGLHALINLGPVLLALKVIPATVSTLMSYLVILGILVIFQNKERTAKRISGINPKEIIYFEQSQDQQKSY